MGEINQGYYFITGWPTDIKPFYVMPSEEDPSKSCAFDLMYRDLEISSGAMRVHQHDLLVERIKKQGLNPDSFSRYLAAFEYGMPPHGGLAFGFDRMIMFLSGTDNIKDVIAFPKNQNAFDPMTEAPNVVDDNQLTELGISRIINE